MPTPVARLTTPGQSRIREVLALVRRGYSSDRAIPHELACELRDACAADDTITTDSVTGRRMDMHRFAWSYLWYLSDGATVREASNVVPLDEVMLIRSEFREAFALGPKFDSTARALFGLAEGKRLPGLSWGLSVYIGGDDLITMVSGGGCHRTLAHYLYGETTVGASRITAYESRHASDPILNQALLFLERTLGVQLFAEHSSERKLLKEIYLSTTPTDLEVVGQYLVETERCRWPYNLDRRSPVSELALHLQKLMVYRGELHRRYLVPWMRNQRLHVLRERDPFIRWYQDRQLRSPDKATSSLLPESGQTEEAS